MLRFPRTLSFLIAALLAFGCSQGEDDDGGNDPGQFGPDSNTTPSVEVVQAQMGSLPLEQRLSGTVLARNQVSIYPEIAARIEQVHVDDGDIVEQGQPLVQLNDRQIREQVRQAEADLKIQQASAEQAQASLRELEAELNRTEDLAEREFVSQMDLERLRAQVEGARAEYNRALAQVEQSEATLDERREALSETVVRSPINGRVGRRNAESGMRVDASSQLFIVGDLSSVRVNITLTEQMLNFVEEGQTAHIHSENLPDTVIVAEISRISPFLEEGSFSTGASIDVPNPDGLLRSGMYVDVDVHYGETEQAALIPNSALQEDPSTGRMGVFIASELGGEIEPALSQNTELRPELSPPTAIRFQEVDVIARGRTSSGVSGISSDDWVVAVGHDLLEMDDDEPTEARTRAIAWDRVLSLQELQQHDLLRQFMDKQQRVAEMERDSTAEDSEHAANPDT